MPTKPSAVFGPYGTRPSDLHGDWYCKVSFHARLIGMELIAKCQDPGDLRLPVGSDWLETLCAKMCVSGPDRRNAKAAMNKLVEAGFLHHEGAFARISLEPEKKLSSVPVEIHSGSTPVPLRFHFGSTPDPKPNKVLEKTQVSASSSKQASLTNQQDRASVRAPAKPIPVAAAGASSLGSLLPPLAKAEPDIEPPLEKPPEIIGYLFVASLLGRSAFDIAPVGSWRAEYAFLGSRPAEERERVARMVNTTEWCQLNPSRVDARHLQRYWQKYLDGPTKPVLVKDPEAEAIRAKRAATYEAQRESDKAREAQITAEAVSSEESARLAAEAVAGLLRKRAAGAAE